MRLKNFLVAAYMALPAIAGSNTTDIAPKLQTLLAEIDLRYKNTFLNLERVVSGRPGVKFDDVISMYNRTVAAQGSYLDKHQPTQALPDTTQLVLCQAYHSLALSGIELNYAFVKHLNILRTTQRLGLESILNKVYTETGRFSTTVARKALPYCYETVHNDNVFIYSSIREAVSVMYLELPGTQRLLQGTQQLM